jgi:hypothetical protein
MDIQPQSQQSISDDQELAKVLAGITQQANGPADASAPLETPVIPMPTLEEPAVADEPAATGSEPVANPVVSPVADDLSAIKSEALNELRPLVDKLNVEPDEKFDTYLLLLRSTDDRSLIAPAYEAAHAIADEARRAQALLDIIKEIDYLSGGQQQ